METATSRIRVLDPHVVNKIAAGEVVERPASVVKELVENALDAGARRVEVYAERGGASLIRVVDDGCGLSREDLAAAFLPHATSKLAEVEDLESIATLGFRGEALASIGAVSHASILSRPPGAESGFLVEDRGGALLPPRAAGSAPGTEVVVRNLFFNTPARARFLRGARTELGHVEDVMVRFALAFPEVGFRLVHDGVELFTTSPGEERLDRIRRLFGPQVAERLLPIAAAAEGGAVEGFVGDPALHRSHAGDLHFFVNGRMVRDRILHRIVRDAYRDALPSGRHPVAFLFVRIDPARIDVNVHPAKAEIRWREPAFLHAVVAPALQAALRGAGTELSAPSREVRIREAVEAYLARAPYGAGPPPPSPGFARTEAPPLRFLQVHDAYLVCETEDGLAVVDPHALHERMNYDRILARLNGGGVGGQRLLVPETVELSAEDEALLEERRDLLRRCGFEWSAFGPGAIALEAVPALLPRERAADVLCDLLELFRARGERVDAKTLFHEVADTMACKASVRFGDRLSGEEVEALLRESGALERSYVCPHGRPTVWQIPLRELERRFGRS